MRDYLLMTLAIVCCLMLTIGVVQIIHEKYFYGIFNCAINVCTLISILKKL